MNYKESRRTDKKEIEWVCKQFFFDGSVCQNLEKHPEHVNWTDEVCCDCNKNVIKTYFEEKTIDDEPAILKGWLKICPHCGKRLTFQKLATLRGDELTLPSDLVNDTTGILDVILSEFDDR